MEETLKAYEIELKLGKCNCIKLKNFCEPKRTIRVKTEPTGWEKMLQNLHYSIHIQNTRGLQKLNSRNIPSHMIKNWIYGWTFLRMQHANDQQLCGKKDH